MTDNEGSGFGLWPRSHRSPAGEAPRTEAGRDLTMADLLDTLRWIIEQDGTIPAKGSEREQRFIDLWTRRLMLPREAAAAPPEPQSTPGATAAFYRARRSAPPEPPRPDQSPVVRCPLCEHPWPCDLHPAPEESGSPASESLETTIRHAVLLGMERASDFYGAPGPDADRLVASLVEQVMNGRNSPPLTQEQWESLNRISESGIAEEPDEAYSDGIDPRTGRPPWDTEV